MVRSWDLGMAQHATERSFELVRGWQLAVDTIVEQPPDDSDATTPRRCDQVVLGAQVLDAQSARHHEIIERGSELPGRNLTCEIEDRSGERRRGDAIDDGRRCAPASVHDRPGAARWTRPRNRDVDRSRLEPVDSVKDGSCSMGDHRAGEAELGRLDLPFPGRRSRGQGIDRGGEPDPRAAGEPVLDHAGAEAERGRLVAPEDAVLSTSQALEGAFEVVGGHGRRWCRGGVTLTRLARSEPCSRTFTCRVLLFRIISGGRLASAGRRNPCTRHRRRRIHPPCESTIGVGGRCDDRSSS